MKISLNALLSSIWKIFPRYNHFSNPNTGSVRLPAFLFILEFLAIYYLLDWAFNLVETDLPVYGASMHRFQIELLFWHWLLTANSPFYNMACIFGFFLMVFMLLSKDSKSSGEWLTLALWLSLFVFFWSLYLFSWFSPFQEGFQYVSVVPWVDSLHLKIDFVTGVDGISIYFLILTTFIMPICLFLECRNDYYEGQMLFINMLLFIEAALIIAFTSLDLLIFFIAFESVLIPMVLMIGKFGTDRRRVKAAYLFFMYSFLSSLFSFFLILYIYSIAGTLNLLVLLDFNFNSNQQIFAWFLLFITFSAKIPMFPLHMWLPEAHVEAPTVGSMILASLLLKLGGYGFIRFSLTLFPQGTFFFLPLVKTLATLSVIYASFAAMYQLDLKKIIAYSSIAHMNIAVLGIFSLHPAGLQGAIFTMISHGLISAALFLMIGIIYDRFNTRSIVYLGGLSFIMPEFSALFFFFMVSNIAFPGTSAFVGEFLTLIGIFSNNIFIFFLTIVGSFLCVVYSIRTFSFVCFGNLPSRNFHRYEMVVDLTREESYCLRLFLILVCFLGIKPNLFLTLSYLPIKVILLKYN